MPKKSAAIRKILALLLVLALFLGMTPLEEPEESAAQGAPLGQSTAMPLADPIQPANLITMTTLVTLDGSPVSNVLVYLYMPNNPMRGRSRYSDSQGMVSFSDIDPEELYFFVVDGTSQYADYRGRYFYPADVKEIQMESGNTVTTTVTLNGVPQADVRVQLVTSSVYVDYYERTDSSGVATFNNIASGTYNYFIVEPAASDNFGTYHGGMKNLVFEVPGPVPDIELDAGQAITANVTIDSVPADYVSVHLNAIREDGRSYTIATESSRTGTVIFNGVPAHDKYYFEVSSRSGRNAKYDGRNYGKIFSIPGTVPDIPLESGHDLSAKVTLNGTAIEWAGVDIYNEHGYVMTSYSDADGLIEFFNIPTSATAYFVADREVDGEYANYVGSMLGKTFSIPSNSYPDIQLKTGANVTIRFVNNGVAVNDAEVCLYQMRDGQGNYLYIQILDVDANGRVTFTSIMEGSNYFVDVFSFDGNCLYDGLASGALFSVPGYPTTIDVATGTITRPSSGGSSGGGISGFSRRGDRAETGTDPFTGRSASGEATATPQAGAVTTEAAVSATQRALEQANGGTAVVQLSNPASISLEALNSMTRTAGSTPLRLHANNTDSEGGTLVRLAINPALATKDIQLGANTQSQQAQSLKNFFGTWFDNQVMALCFTEPDSFGMPVEVAVKLDAGMETGELMVYAYNSANNSYERVQTQVVVDENGYAHFTLHQAGQLIISKGTLRQN